MQCKNAWGKIEFMAKMSTPPLIFWQFKHCMRPVIVMIQDTRPVTSDCNENASAQTTHTVSRCHNSHAMLSAHSITQTVHTSRCKTTTLWVTFELHSTRIPRHSTTLYSLSSSNSEHFVTVRLLVTGFTGNSWNISRGRDFPAKSSNIFK